MILKLYYITIVLYLLTFFFRSIKLRIIELLTGAMSVSTNLVFLVLIYLKTDHVPVYNNFESFLFASFILGAITLFHYSNNEDYPKLRLWAWIGILILLSVTMFFPQEPEAINYDYDYSYKLCFHLFRTLSIAILMLSGVYFTQFLLDREWDEKSKQLSHLGRNFLMLSTVFFLISEYTGIIWCQEGWGEFWLWNQNFMQSILITTYLMLAIHIPGNSRKAADIRAVIGGLGGIFVIMLTLLRSFFA